MAKRDLYIRRGVLKRGVDGDNCWITLDLGYDVSKAVNVRLARIDAHETDDPDPVLASKGKEAMHHLNLLLTGRSLWTFSKKYDRNGRSISEVYYDKKGVADTSISISDLMVRDGHAWYEEF